MKTLLSLAALLALTSTAAAESYDATQPHPRAGTYLGVGASIGAQRALQGGLSLDAGFRLGDSVLFARGQVTAGKSGSDGEFQQARAGLEARGCTVREFVCGFAGLDVGYQHDNVIDQPWTLFGPPQEPYMTEAHDFIAVPRVGVELGRELRLRGSLELPTYARLDEHERGNGLALSVGLGYAF